MRIRLATDILVFFSLATHRARPGKRRRELFCGLPRPNLAANACHIASCFRRADELTCRIPSGRGTAPGGQCPHVDYSKDVFQ